MKCAWQECKDKATHYPKVMVPAVSWPIELHQPLGVVLSLGLCLKHCKEFDAKEFINMPTPKGEGTHKMLFELATRGKLPPDFERVYVQPIPINCKEAKLFFKGKTESTVAVTEKKDV